MKEITIDKPLSKSNPVFNLPKNLNRLYGARLVSKNLINLNNLDLGFIIKTDKTEFPRKPIIPNSKDGTVYEFRFNPIIDNFSDIEIIITGDNDFELIGLFLVD